MTAVAEREFREEAVNGRFQGAAVGRLESRDRLLWVYSVEELGLANELAGKMQPLK